MSKVVCPYCVQWRCVVCHATDICDHDYTGAGSEPYWPDGSVAELTQQVPCAPCEETLAAYYEDHT